MRPGASDDHARWGTVAWVSLIVPLAAFIVWPDDWWTPILLAVWGVAVMVILLRNAQKKWRERSSRMLEHARMTAIRTLSHHRHDWMNDLQILYGYLRLNKPDKAADHVNKIRERMEIDSRVSQLGHPALSLFLLSFRTMSESMRLEVEISEGLSLDRLSLDVNRVADCLIVIINLFRFRSVPSAMSENVLMMKLMAQGNSLCVELAYEGTWAAQQNLAAEAAALLDGLGQLTVEESSESASGNASRLRIIFPLTA